MKALENLLARAAPHFEPGGRLARFHAIFEATDTFILTPPSVTRGASHVRDSIDLKRMMTIVVIAMLPCVLMAMYNTGLQANMALDPIEARHAHRLAARHHARRWATATTRGASRSASSTARSTSCRSTP